MAAEDKQRWKNHDDVPEEYLLTKFKGLRFYYPDTRNAVYKVSESNLDWKGRDGWVAIAEKEGGDDSQDEPITLELVCELVAASADLNEGVEIVKEPET